MKSFVGRFQCTLDAKGRLMVPAKFRKIIPPEANDLLVVSKGKENCLNLYPSNEWDELIKRLYALPPGADKRNLIRFYSDTSQPLNLDKAGRVAIPAEFLALIGSPKKVVTIGALSYIEIWAPGDYETIRKKAMDTYVDGEWEY